MRSLVVLVLLLSLCGACFAQGHYHFAGPMSQFLVEGAAPGAVTGGLPFAVVLSDAGATIAPTTFTLTAEGWEGEAKLTLENAKFADGHLTATLRLSNDTRSALEGLRLDVTGATEEYQAKDEQGKDILKTRAQPVAIASPILFGDVAKRDTADPQPFDAAPLTFQPETTKITVSGVLSGLYYAGALAPAVVKGWSVWSVDTDAQGRLYMAVRGKNDLYRCDANGENGVAVAKLPKYGPGNIAVDPLKGDVLATSYEVYCYGANGADKGMIAKFSGPTEDRLRGNARVIRFDRKGNLYVADDERLACYFDNQRLWDVDRAGEYRFNSGFYFDVDPEGRFWVADQVAKAFYVMGRKGEGARRLAAGLDWRLGSVSTPRGVRADAHGNIYVTEGGINQPTLKEAQRISVFDKDGRLVRVFGRADRSPDAKGNPLDGQIGPLACDMAFGPDGRLYVANQNDKVQIMVFRPF